MNERIQELKKQASTYASTKSKEAEEWRWIYEEKFAELIVRECAGICDAYGMPDGTSIAAMILSDAIKRRFGVEE